MFWTLDTTRPRRATISVLLAASGALMIACHAFGAEGLQLLPRQTAIKAEAPEWDARIHQRDVIWVKFTDDLVVRLRDGQLADLGTGALAGAQEALARLAQGTWARSLEPTEERLARLRENAQRNLGRAVADPNSQFVYRLGPGADVQAILSLLNGLEAVEIALPMPQPVASPLPPDFESGQIYISAGPRGVGAVPSWTLSDTLGEGVRVAVIEYSFNPNHVDMPPVPIIGPTPIDPFSNPHHGTASLGVVGAISNGFGTTGISPGSRLYMSPANTAAGYSISAAVTRVLEVLGPGDVIFIEHQMAGPTGDFIPVEWYLPDYLAIVLAVGNGVTVVEPAANGSQDLDAPVFSQRNGGHWPFLPENDSGAIIVGAGGAPGPWGSTVDRSRLSFSGFGSTVDLQGWGEGVRTLGYGDIYTAGGVNQFYTSAFAGTSSGTAMVAGACALLQSVHRAATGGLVLTPAQVRDVLRATGAPQQGGVFPAAQNIGPRPDVFAAVLSLTGCDSTQTPADCNGNGFPDACEIAFHHALDCNADGVPDECEVTSVQLASPQFAPFGATPFTATFTSPLPAESDVTLTIRAQGDLSAESEFVSVSLGGRPLGVVFQTGATDCASPPSTATLTVPRGDWNSAIAGGTASIVMTPSADVYQWQCVYTWISVSVAYDGLAPLDRDGSGAIDACKGLPPTPPPADCNGNGLADELEVAAGTIEDCNRNGVPDSCEQAMISIASPPLWPVVAGTVQTFTVTSPLPAVTGVTLTFTASADFGFASENVSVALNGAPIGTVFQSGAHDCAVPPDVQSLSVPPATWNSAARTGLCTIAMTPSSGVAIGVCGGSFIAVAISYEADAPLDGDGNGVIDSCAPVFPGDLDGDRDVDGVDLAMLLAAWGPCPPRSACPADLDRDGLVNGIDLAMLLAAWTG